jgi:hypothetical protein
MPDNGRIVMLLADTIAGHSRWVTRQWKRVHRCPDDPDALPPERTARGLRKGRLARNEDLIARGVAPPRR